MFEGKTKSFPLPYKFFTLGKMKKMGHNKIVLLVTAGLLLFTAAFFYTFQGEAEEYRAGISKGVKVEKTWKLPSLLEEVSGIAFLAPNRMACVQDERGSIFIFNLETSKIEKEIKFAGKGDFEGITLQGNTAYILQSNGSIYRVKDFLGAAKTDKFDTFFSSKNDTEGLFYDSSQNRLLVSVKATDPVQEDQKNIYAVQLPAMDAAKDPVYKIDFENREFKRLIKEKGSESFFPSEVAIHPSTGEILILEAREPRLLILDPSGAPKVMHRLDPKLFPQPEGLTFDNSDNLYISNEGDPATIHRVTITSD